MKAGWEAVIGLEVHAELATRTKIFCACPTAFGQPPNAQACPVCAGLPGALPVLNAEAVALAARTGLALGGKVAPCSRFDRKNYFYPDLPKGYQISQLALPIVSGAYLDLPLDEGTRRIRIDRIHLEEDAGKLVHRGASGLAGATHSLVDLNRAGVPLVEIVSAPDLRSAEEARLYLQELRLVLLTLGVNDGRLEEGSLRCDANVSVRRTGTRQLGTRVEIKNLNSFRFLQRAIETEIQRQIQRLEEGESVLQETRLWKEERGMTISMRSKEDAADYRYFPDPDLPDVVLDMAWLEAIARDMPELPAARRAKAMEGGLSVAESGQIAADPGLWNLFVSVTGHGPTMRETARWLLGEGLACLSGQELAPESVSAQAAGFARLILMVRDRRLAAPAFRRLVKEVLVDGADPEALARAQGLWLEPDDGKAARIVDEVLRGLPDQVTQWRQGKQQVRGFLMGQVMRALQGQGDPTTVGPLVDAWLSKEADPAGGTF
ncbi:MAG: Asp-tRNA(Asn)/Glu-tRNA(Gln) amidotransferase subunit GatB [Candidatus Sericytochromatia bacterium]|nr:Asp-tRNA(Asn)/Glu-tRNA(Gln) amidotransferase subunit GatB [Candidatus Sericytochromatia bacterium]